MTYDPHKRRTASELLSLGNSQQQVAKLLHIDARTIRRWAKEDPEFAVIIHERDRDIVDQVREHVLQVASRPIGEITPAVQFRYIELVLRSAEPERYDPAVRRNEYELNRDDERRRAEEEAAMQAAGDDQYDIELGRLVEIWEQRLLDGARVAAMDADDYEPDDTAPSPRRTDGVGRGRA